MKTIRWLRWKILWWKWYFTWPYRLGDPLLGPEGPIRQHNRKVLWDRWEELEPKEPKWR